jgi:adenine deaminase
MAAARSAPISVPATSTSVRGAISRPAGDEASAQRDRVLEHAELVRVEHGLERDPEMRERLRASAAEWLD